MAVDIYKYWSRMGTRHSLAWRRNQDRTFSKRHYQEGYRGETISIQHYNAGCLCGFHAQYAGLQSPKAPLCTTFAIAIADTIANANMR